MAALAPVTKNNVEVPNNSGKMFIGGLSWQTTPDSLKDYFATFGEVKETTVMKDPNTLRSRGFGFVTYKDPASVDKVTKQGHHELDGKRIDPKVALHKRSIPKMVTNTKKIFVGGLESSTTIDDLKDYFGMYGSVEDAMLMMDKHTQRHRGFGFLSFDNEETVKQICDIHFHEINGKMAEVKIAQPKKVIFSENISKPALAGALQTPINLYYYNLLMAATYPQLGDFNNNLGPLSSSVPSLQPGMPSFPPTSMSNAPQPHINPAFQPPCGPGVLHEMFGAPPASQPPLFGMCPGIPSPGFLSQDPTPATAPTMSKSEMEEYLQINKQVSSNAISRAVQDASAGDYAPAIETLVTAISLIKQSKVAHDDRCKNLIMSLQVALEGVESGAYGASKRKRSRSPDNYCREKSPSRKDRSRCRERYHRDNRNKIGFPSKDRVEAVSPPMSESEMEEHLQKNKEVSSNAISSAIKEASAGDYASAIETLVTAISLIKQSKVTHDERRIILISLEDTLHGIERRSKYPRSRSPDRYCRERSESGRDRSWCSECFRLGFLSKDPPAAVSPPMSESEKEEQLQKNKEVSSYAISRAIKDTSAGEYASAIETLVTAISLIKQSKVTRDEKRINLISLHDALHGMERRSYGASKHQRSRPPDADFREKRCQWGRSWSREHSPHKHRDRSGDYRDGSRDREYNYMLEENEGRHR